MPKILIVEDDKMQRVMLSQFLKRAGFETIAASDGVEAVDVAKHELPDLIIMDLGMPLLDGWEAITRLRNLPITASIPILALTAFAAQSDISRALEVGANDCIIKPIDDFELVLARIRNLIQRNRT